MQCALTIAQIPINATHFSSKNSDVPLKRHWCAFHIVQRHKHTFISLITKSHTKNITHFSLGEKMFKCVVHLLAHLAKHQDRSWHVHHSDVNHLAVFFEQHTPHNGGLVLFGVLSEIFWVRQSEVLNDIVEQLPAFLYGKKLCYKRSCYGQGNCGEGCKTMAEEKSLQVRKINKRA